MSTKLDSLFAVQNYAFKVKEQIVAALLMRAPMTRAELAAVLGLRLSSVCGRVNELLASGLVVVAGTKFDAETKRNVETVSLK